MIMIETIFALLAAIITIFIAELLVRKQHEQEKSTKLLEEQNKFTLENMTADISALTHEKSIECSLYNLEQRLDAFNQTLMIIQQPTYKRRKNNVKRKKNFAND